MSFERPLQDKPSVGETAIEQAAANIRKNARSGDTEEAVDQLKRVLLERRGQASEDFEKIGEHYEAYTDQDLEDLIGLLEVGTKKLDSKTDPKSDTDEILEGLRSLRDREDR